MTTEYYCHDCDRQFMTRCPVCGASPDPEPAVEEGALTPTALAYEQGTLVALPQEFSFYGEGKALMTMKTDGTLVVGEGLSDDEATRKLAAMLAEHYGNEMRIRAEDASPDIAALVETLTTWHDDPMWADHVELPKLWLLNTIKVLKRTGRQRDEARALVERAFRDGITYATNVKVTDAELAWQQSKVREELGRA